MIISILFLCLSFFNPFFNTQIFGIFFIYVQSRITTIYGSLPGNIFISSSLLIGTILTGNKTKLFIKPIENELFIFFKKEL